MPALLPLRSDCVAAVLALGLAACGGVDLGTTDATNVNEALDSCPRVSARPSAATAT